MGNISLDSFRTMASGVGGFESVAVVTNSKTNELSLEGRNVSPASEENLRTRETLVSLMAADLHTSFGVDDEAVRQFIETLHRDLVESHGAEALDRGGALSKAFDTFDAFKVKKLTERKFTRDIESAERNFVYQKIKYVSDYGSRLKGKKDAFYSGKEYYEKLVKGDQRALDSFVQDTEKGFENVPKRFQKHCQAVKLYGQQLDALANGQDDKLTEDQRKQLRQLLVDVGWEKVEGDAQGSGEAPNITKALKLLGQMGALKKEMVQNQSRKEFWKSLVANDSAVAPLVPKNDPDREWKVEKSQQLVALRNACKVHQAKADSLQKVANYLLHHQPGKDERAEDVFKMAVSAEDAGNKDKVDQEMALFRKDKNMRADVQKMMDLAGEYKTAQRDEGEWKAFQKNLNEKAFEDVVKEADPDKWGYDIVQDLNKRKTAIGEATQRKEAAVKYFDSSSEDFKKGMAAVENEYDGLLRSLSARGKSSISDRLKVLCRQAGVKISDKTFVRFITERQEAIKQTAFALIGGADLKGEKLSAQNAIVQAIRTLRDIEINAGKRKRADVQLNANDQALVNFLVKSNSVESLKVFLRDNASFRKCLNEVLQGGFRLLASVPNTDKSVTLLVPVSADGKKKENITLLQSKDNKLRFSYKGRTFEMASTAADMYLRIKDAMRIDPLSDEEWKEYYDVTSSDVDPKARDAHQNFNGKVLQWVNQEVAVARVDEMLKALRECNNADPGVYGGAPHFMNKMPRLDPKGSQTVKVLGFDTGRTETFVRTFCNQQIEKGGRLTRWFWKRVASFAGVPLQLGSAQSGSNTLFESAALFLNQLRLFAQNANYLRFRFNEALNPVKGRSEAKILEEACAEFSRLTQFTLHPVYKGDRMSHEQCMTGYRDALLTFYQAFKKAQESDQLKDFFQMLTSGACFNGCSGIVQDYCVEKFGMAPSWDDDELFKPSASAHSAVTQPKEPDANDRANDVPNVNDPTNDSVPNVNDPTNDGVPNVNDPTNDVIVQTSTASKSENTQKESEVNASEPVKDPVREAFETKKKNGELVIDPDFEPKHGAGESVIGYFRRELNALNNTFNPPGTTEPKVFTWNEVKPFLEERVKQITLKVLDFTLGQSWDNYWKMGQKNVELLQAMTVEERRAWKKNTLDPAAAKGSEGALWLQGFLDVEKPALRERSITAGRSLQKQELGDMFDKLTKPNASGVQPPNASGVQPPNTVIERMIKRVIEERSGNRNIPFACYVDENGTVQSKKITDVDFLSVAEKLLKEDKLIADDGTLLFLRNDDIAKALPPEPAAAEPQDLQKAFEAKKEAGMPAIDPKVAQNLHLGTEDAYGFFKSEIISMYSVSNPPGTRRPKVFSWEEVKSFLQERLEGLDGAAREKAAAKKLKELKARPAQLQQILLSANDKLVTLFQNLNWGKDFLNRFLKANDAGRQNALNAKSLTTAQKNWLKDFVSGKNFKPEFSLKESTEKWLVDFASAGDAKRRKLADELKEEKGPMLTLVENFVDLDKAAFKEEFVNAEGRAVQAKIRNRLGPLADPENALLSKRKEAQAWLKAFAKAGEAAKAALVKELKKVEGPILTLVGEFVDLENSAFKKEFVNDGGATKDADITNRLNQLTDPASIKKEDKEKALEAAQEFLSARLERFVKRQQSIIADARVELANLVNPDYLKGEMEKAKHEGGLKLYFDQEDMPNGGKDQAEGLEIAEYQPGFSYGDEGVDLEYYQATEKVSCGKDNPVFWDMVATNLTRNRVIKADDKREYVNGGEGIQLTIPKDGETQFIKIRRVTGVDEANEEWEYYDPVKHGVDFIEVRDEKGDHQFVWRSPDGRYQVMGVQSAKLNRIADISGDAEYKRGDVYIVKD